MSGMNEDLFKFITLGLIVSDDKDKPSDKSSNQKVIFPMIHDPDGVKQEHLAFSPMAHSPTSASQVSFQGALDPGSLVYCLKMPGENGCVILGQANDLVNYDHGGQGGGDSLLGHQFFQDLFDRERDILVPPEIKQTEEDGVKVKAIKEKGKKHKHSLLKGLQSHNAIQQTTGYKLEEQKEIPTAKQHFDAIPTNNMLGQMPGDLSSLGGMFQGLMGGLMGGGGGGAGGGGSGAGSTGSGAGNVAQGAGIGANTGQTTLSGQTPMDRIKRSIKPELFDAMMSLSVLTQGDAQSDVMSFATGGRVHTPTYLAHAEDLLKQVTCLEDLFVALHRLQYDTSLFGHDKLEDQIIAVETAYGNANLHISITGSIDFIYANSNTQNTYVTSPRPLTSPPGQNSGGGGGGGAAGAQSIPGNMFGKASEMMKDMFKRLPKNNQKESKNMTEKLNEEDMAKKLWKFAQDTINGGNPLDPKNFG